MKKIISHLQKVSKLIENSHLVIDKGNSLGRSICESGLKQIFGQAGRSDVSESLFCVRRHVAACDGSSVRHAVVAPHTETNDVLTHFVYHVKYIFKAVDLFKDPISNKLFSCQECYSESNVVLGTFQK